MKTSKHTLPSNWSSQRTILIASLSLMLSLQGSWMIQIVKAKNPTTSTASFKSATSRIAGHIGSSSIGPTNPAELNRWTTNGPEAPVSSLVMDPASPSTLYAATNKGLFRTTDGGANWTSLYNDNPFTDALAVAPSDPSIVYAGQGPAGLRSVNGGRTWDYWEVGWVFNEFASSIAVKPDDPNTIFTGFCAFDPTTGCDAFVLKSADGGRHWKVVFYANVWALMNTTNELVIDPSHPRTVYAGLWGGVVKSTDEGTTWQYLYQGLGNAMINALAIDPSEPNTVYAGAGDGDSTEAWGGGIYKSVDGGLNWRSTGPGTAVVRSLVIDPSNAQTIYAGTVGKGIFKSVDGAKTWFEFNDGLTSLNINALAIDPSGTQLHAATSTGVFDIQLQPPLPSPLDDPQFFVRQQYRDFLGREPDSIGFGNWIETLGNCPNGGYGEFANPECDRVHVSAGFFQSDEFLGRGYWLLRFGFVGLNRSVGSTRSSLSYAEFSPALQQIGGSNSPAQEEAAKTVFANAFVRRSDFEALFPQTLSNSQYVDGLESNAGVTLTNKQTLIDGLNNMTMTRADVLRSVVESQVVFDKFIIPSFVTMEYFGYLRRDVDEIGYRNWVDTLTADPRNYRHMIFGFIYSKEYRGRFGQ